MLVDEGMRTERAAATISSAILVMFPQGLQSTCASCGCDGEEGDVRAGESPLPKHLPEEGVSGAALELNPSTVFAWEP